MTHCNFIHFEQQLAVVWSDCLLAVTGSVRLVSSQVGDRSSGRPEGGFEEDAQRLPEPGLLQEGLQRAADAVLLQTRQCNDLWGFYFEEGFIWM